MTELLRPPRESAVPGSLGWFAARNAVWGALFGVVISIAWMVIIQDFWFAVHIALVSAALSTVYGAVSSVPAFLVGNGAAHFRLLVVGVIFAGTAMAIQVGLIVLVNAAWSFTWHAAAYSVLGAVTAVLHSEARSANHRGHYRSERLGSAALKDPLSSGRHTG